MANWRDDILKHFSKGISRLTIVSDPDALLTEEEIQTEIKQRGFDLIPFEDSIAFRYAYESKYRSVWDNGNDTDLVVILRSDRGIDDLPYDLLQAGRKLRFSLHELFPNLSYPVLTELDKSLLDPLYERNRRQDGTRLGEHATKEFVLTHCFGIVPDLIGSPVELMRMLLSQHYQHVPVPDVLVDYLVGSLRSKREFAGWPVQEIVPSREDFLVFLQEQWSLHLQAERSADNPCLVPFDHQDVRAYIDTFFLEGLLKPVRVEGAEKLPTWVQVGVAQDPQADALDRMRKLIQRCREKLPGAGALHRDWQMTARQWSELVVLRWELEGVLEPKDRQTYDELHAEIEKRFEGWMVARFSSLHNLPFLPEPVMVHHIPRFLASQWNRQMVRKAALLVMDGLALDQWVILRRHLEEQEPDWRMKEASAFAWVPTLTSVSRQSIFAGDMPLGFPDSFETTMKEESHWKRFWEDRGLSRNAVEYLKKVESAGAEPLTTSLNNPHLVFLGIVVNVVDEIMHGEQQGTAGMHDAIRLWAPQARSIIGRLLDEGCTVFLTADHGNVAAVGMGKPREGVLVEVGGKRARIYETNGFRREAQQTFPQTIEWPDTGLPPSRHVLLPEGLNAFADPGRRIVSHGGIALEEVVVPFVTITGGQDQ